MDKNIITRAKLYSDANDAAIADEAKALLENTRFEAKCVKDALLKSNNPHLIELGEYIFEKGL